MIAELHRDNLLVRLSKTDKEEVLATYDGMRPFEPMKERAMKEYVGVPNSIYAHSAIFKKLLELSYQYVASFPSKTQKKKIS